MKVGVHPGRLCRSLRELGHHIRSDRLGTDRGPREDETVVKDVEFETCCEALNGCPVPPQRLEPEAIETDRAALVRLRGFLPPATPIRLIYGSGDGDGLGGEVDIGPTQRAQLATAGPGQRREEEEGRQGRLGLVGLSEDGLNLCRGRGLIRTACTAGGWAFRATFRSTMLPFSA